jgi:PAS domain S-box-containing protein
MKRKNSTDAIKFRQKAEALLNKKQKKPKSTDLEVDTLALIHELEVHQIELEMQNDELVIAKENAEALEKKYTELYDFAPIGYLTLSKTAEITEINFAAASMLQKERLHLIKTNFTLYISQNSHLVFNTFLERVFKSILKQTCEVTLSIKNHSPIYVNIDGILSSDGNECLIALADITLKKEAEDKLIQSELKFRNLAETAKVAIAIYGAALGKEDCFYVNTYWETITGYSKKEAENMEALAIVAPEFKAIVKERAQMRLSGKKVSDNYEIRIITKNGDSRWIEFSATLIKFGGKDAILSSAIDTTERKNFGLKLQRSTQLLEASQRIAKVGGWELDIATGSLFWTDETYRIHDTSPSEFNPTVDAGVSYFLPESRKIISKALKLAMEKGVGYDLELETYTTKGRYIVVRTTCEVTLHEGKPIKLTGAFQDITKQKEQETKLIEAKEKAEISQVFLDNIIDNIGDAVFVKDEESRLLLVNDAFCKLFDLKRENVIGKTLAEDVLPAERESFLRADKNVINTGIESLVEEELTVRNLKPKIISSRKTRYIDAHNKKYLIGISRDVTQKINSEKQLQESKTKFEILSEVTFEGILIHDNGVPVDMNTAFPKLFGYTKGEFLNKNLIKIIIHKNNQETVINHIKIEYHRPYEVIGIKKDGTEFPLEIEGKTYLSQDNKKLRATAFRDITERKIAEQKIKDSEAKINSILNSLPSSVCVIDDAGNILHVNDAWKQFGATNSNKIKDTTCTEYNYFDVCKSDFENEDTNLILEGLIGLLNGKIEKFEYEYPCHTPNEKHWFLMSADLMKTSEKQIVISHRDVTSLKIAEQELKESLYKNKLAIDIAQLGVWTFDAKTNKLIWNDTLFEIFDTTPEEFDGTRESFEKYIHPKDLEYVNTEQQKVFEKEPMSNINFRIQRPSGEIRDIEASAIPIVEADKLVKILGVNRDVTEAVMAKKKLNDAFNEISDLKLKLEAENVYLKEELKLEGSFEDIIGTSKSLKKVLKQVEHVAKTDTTVLVLGETGTGKELIAKAVHSNSNRKNKPLIKVNCSALPAELIESELFGHEKGAFTGAINRKIGRFELAHNGTIFLDEIGDLPIDLQTRLLRVLQENEFERLGGETTIKVDVRVITATNRNLEELVVEGKFRQDLYYRLNVFPITSPPLRKRKEDIPSLIHYFINKHNNKTKNVIKSVHKNAIDKLVNYDWPGNVRELEHVIERAIVLNYGSQLRLGNWFVGDNTDMALHKEFITLEQSERDYIAKVLEKTNGKIRGKNGAAEILGLKPTTLESRMKKLNISKNK